MNEPFKILIIDAIALTGEKLKSIFNQIPFARFDLVQVQRLSEAVNWLSKNMADVIIMGLWLPDGYGRDSLSTLHKLSPDTPVVVLSDEEDYETARSLQDEGADGILMRSLKGSFEQIRCIAELCKRRNLLI